VNKRREKGREGGREEWIDCGDHDEEERGRQRIDDKKC